MQKYYCNYFWDVSSLKIRVQQNSLTVELQHLNVCTKKRKHEYVELKKWKHKSVPAVGVDHFILVCCMYRAACLPKWTNVCALRTNSKYESTFILNGITMTQLYRLGTVTLKKTKVEENMNK
jgi:hypothetical protein